MTESALERVARLSQASALVKVELSTATVHQHTRRTKSGKVENVRTYLRHDERIGHGMGAKKGIFARAASATSSSSGGPAAPAPAKSRKSLPRIERASSKDKVVGVGRRYGGKAGYLHKDVTSQARRKLMEQGNLLDATDRKTLFAQQGIKLSHPELSPHEMFDRFNKATGQERQDLQDEMENVAKASALYLAMMDHANKERKLAAIKDRNQGTWDRAVLKFGKSGQALLNVRDKLLTTKAVETASKAAENVKEFGKDVRNRVVEGTLASVLVGTVVAGASHFASSDLVGEHIAHLLEGRFSEAIIGAAVAAGMSVGVQIAKKHAKRLKAQPRRAALPAAAGSSMRGT